MSVLSDIDIMKTIERGQLVIDPFKKKNLTPNGYDLTVSEVLIPEIIRKVTEGKALIPARSWFAIATRERIRLGATLVGHCWIRTTFARQGLIPAFGMIDAGFDGTLTLNFYNSSRSDRVLDIGERIAQLVIQKLTSAPSSLYDEKSGNYQGQTGVTLSRKILSD